MATSAKDLKKIGVGERFDPGELQFQQRSLAWVGIHRIDAGRSRQGVVQDVTASAGNHQ